MAGLAFCALSSAGGAREPALAWVSARRLCPALQRLRMAAPSC